MAGDPGQGFVAGTEVPAAATAGLVVSGQGKGPTGGKQSLASQC